MNSTSGAGEAPPAAHPLPQHFETSVGFLLNKAAQALLEDFEHALAPFGLTARDFGVLRFIDLNGSHSQQQIGGHLRIDRTTMVAIVDGLEETGYVTRVRDPHDRRRYAVVLTEQGQERLHAELVPIEGEITDQFLQGVSPADRDRLVQLLVRLVDDAEHRRSG